VDVDPFAAAADVVRAVLAEAGARDELVEVGVSGRRRTTALARTVTTVGGPALDPSPSSCSPGRRRHHRRDRHGAGAAASLAASRC